MEESFLAAVAGCFPGNPGHGVFIPMKNIKKIEHRWVGTYGAGGVSGQPASRNPWSNIWAAMASRLALRF